MSSEEKYFNFPVQLLDGFLADSKKCLNDITDYAIYENSLNLEYGTELQKFKDSSGFYNVTLGSAKKSFSNGKELFDSLPENSPKVGISTSIFWDFYKNEKTEFEKVCLLGFLGLKSIIGKKTYINLSNNYWLARMDGKTHTVKEVLELSEPLRTFANRYQLTKIKNELFDNWGLIYYSRFMKGWYASFKLDLEQLVFEAEKKRKTLIEKKRNDKFNDARLKALNRLNSKAPP